MSALLHGRDHEGYSRPRLRLTSLPPAGRLQPADAGPFHDRIAARSQRMDERFPEAITLEAAIVARLHAELRGHAEQLRGVRSGDSFRSILQGEKALHVSDLCRLATSDHPVAKRAFAAVVELLAAAAGCRLEACTAAGQEHDVASQLEALAATLRRADRTSPDDRA